MVALIPREVLFGNPARTAPALSADGAHLAWIAPSEGVLNIWAAPVTAAGIDWSAAGPVTDDSGAGIRDFTWTRLPGRLLYLQDENGDENWRLHDVDVRTRARRDLTPFPGVQARIEAVRRNLPDDVLIGLNRDNPELHDLYRLTLSTGELVRVAENPGYAEWVVDEDMVPRGAWGPTREGGFVLLVRDDLQSDWRRLLTVGPQDAAFIDALSFSGDGKSVFVIDATGADTARLVKVDVATGETDVVFEDGEVDVSGALLHPVTREPQVVTVVRDRTEHHVVDPALQDDFTALRALHPGIAKVVGRAEDDRVWLVEFSSDTRPVEYFTYDRDSRTGASLFQTRPWLADYELAPMEPFSYTARDGLTIHGYLTFPPGVDRSGLPVVLNVHGGPQLRDSWHFHPGAQWLANRGYLCVQVNYRGSIGYGKRFVAAGDREWGGKMQDDLLDVVDHVITNGWADPRRIAIYGGSYGGYAALVGAAFTPDVFRCAVDFVGPANLKTFVESLPPYWATMAEQLYRQVGHPQEDEEFLWSRSPLSRVRDIRIPVLVAHGGNDPRVKQSESEQIVDALARAGIEHEYLLFPDEGHGFARPENRLRFYAATERFLARHLQGRFEE
ncbi:MAG: S9 family peptidase [Kibdelosporangium sp.]